MQAIIKLLMEYNDNMLLKDELDEKLLTIEKKSELVSFIKKRAEEIQRISDENQKLIKQINELCKQTPTIEEADKILKELDDFFIDYLVEYVAMKPVIDMLISVYEPTNRYYALSGLYFMKGFKIYDEIIKQNYMEEVDGAISYYKKSLEMTYKHIETAGKIVPERRMFLCFDNMAIAYDSLGKPMEAFNIFKEMIAFYDKMEKTEVATKFYKETITNWCYPLNTINELTDEAKIVYLEKIGEIYNEYLQNGKTTLDIPYFLYIASLSIRMANHKITPEAAAKTYIKYFKDRLNKLYSQKEFSEIDLAAVYASSQDHLFFMNANTDPVIISELYNQMDDFLGKGWNALLDDAIDPFYKSVLLYEWDSGCVKYMPEAVKEKKLLDGIVKTQFSTYLHSILVEKISLMIFESLYKNDKELFESLDMSYKDLTTYISKSALFHDIGKISICNVINLQTRPLNDYEFQSIKTHPTKGYKIIENDNVLAKYGDVILGHHKTYNAKAGYPNDFDNSKSKYRIIIDLIRIADTIDAATDQIGRCYKTAKSFDELMNELILGKDTSYNPDIVDDIITDKALYKRLKKLVEDDRIDFMCDTLIKYKG